jgi:hypothetical protein
MSASASNIDPPETEGELPTEDSGEGRPARQQGERFREGDDPQQQLKEIEEALRRVRAGKCDKIIDSIEQSKQRLRNKFNRIRRREDLEQ